MNVASKTLFAMLMSASLLSGCGSKEEAPSEATAEAAK
jgi:outer membrane lipoprotein-sorting protein